jgi:hypothetical protein
MHAPPPTGTTGKAPPAPVGPLGRGGGVSVWLTKALDAPASPVEAPPGDAMPAAAPNPTAKARAIAPPRGAIALPDKRAP